MGVATVEARTYPVVTQARWSMPPSSPTIVGSAGATIMLSSCASSMAMISPLIAVTIWRGESRAALLVSFHCGSFGSWFAGHLPLG